MSTKLSKTTRFEVFKRDSFTCRYCGAQPPGVVLHVDHVLALANGGLSELDNLVTACSECNLGKGARFLRSIPATVDVEAQKERLEQLREYQDFLLEQKRFYDGLVDEVCKVWGRFDGQDENASGWEIPKGFDASVMAFIKRLPMVEIFEAVEIAYRKHPGDYWQRFKYFCGVCWKKIRLRENPE